VLMMKTANVCSTSIYGSAVCVYNLSSIDAVFGGPYKSQVDAKSAWTRVTNNNVVQCGNVSLEPDTTVHSRITPNGTNDTGDSYMMYKVPNDNPCPFPVSPIPLHLAQFSFP